MGVLTQAQKTGLADVLAARDRELRNEIRAELLQSADQKYIDFAGQVHDLGDESVADMLTDLGSMLVERHLKELREVVAARRRLATGDINRCVNCHNEIGFKRLLANPLATRCIACQGQHEKEYAYPAMPRL